MQYAIVEGSRAAAAPGLRGECPHCGSPVLSKCGKQKIWHWSHLGKRQCDPWWEPETEWHRRWKAHFPPDWHEVGHRAPDGERHIADLKAPHGLVIEFQHSAITEIERSARTGFYGNMTWVVDGMRRNRDGPRFSKSTFDWRTLRPNMWALDCPDEALPKDWLECKVPVFFDFGPENIRAPGDPVPKPPTLWCLFPEHRESEGIRGRLIMEIPVRDFIANALTGHPLPEWEKILRQREDEYREKQLVLLKREVEERNRVRHYRWARRNGLS